MPPPHFYSIILYTSDSSYQTFLPSSSSYNGEGRDSSTSSYNEGGSSFTSLFVSFFFFIYLNFLW